MEKIPFAESSRNEEIKQNNHSQIHFKLERKYVTIKLAEALKNDKLILHAIEESKKLRKIETKAIIALLGATQVGKSSTLNFISDVEPFLERGYVKSDVFVLNDMDNKNYIDKKDSEKIFKYLIEEKLLTREIDEDGKEIDHYVVNFKIGDGITSQEETQEKWNLFNFLKTINPHGDVDPLKNFILEKLINSKRRKDMSDNGEPSIGFVNPIFTYGAGNSTTICAQIKNHVWTTNENELLNVTTLDLPGAGDVRGVCYNMTSAFTTWCALSKTKTMKGAIIMMSYRQLQESAVAAKTLANILSSAVSMLGSSINKNNIIFLISKVPLAIAKQTRGGTKMIPQDNEALKEIVKLELKKFVDLMKSDDDYSDVRDLVSHILTNNRYLHVAPIKDWLSDTFDGSVNKENINYSNKESIIQLISSLEETEVRENYFDSVFSDKNISIRDIVRTIEDELFSVASICFKHKNELETKNAELRSALSILKCLETHCEFYIFDIERSLEMERKHFKIELEKLSRGIRGWVNYDELLQPGMLTREAVQRAVSLEARRSLTSDHYEHNFRDLKTRKEEIEKEIEQNKLVLESVMKNREVILNKMIMCFQDREKSGEQYEEYKTQNIEATAYFNRINQEIKLICYDQSLIDNLRWDINWYVDQGGFQLGTRVRVINSYNNSKEILFDIKSSKSPGLFSNYTYSCNLKLMVKKSDLITKKINIIQTYLDSIKETIDRRTNEQISLEKKLDLLIKQINEEEMLAADLKKERNEYLVKLKDILKNVHLEKEDNLITTTDIRKIMVATIISDAQHAITTAKDTIYNIVEYMNNETFKHNQILISSFLSSFQELEDTIEISRCLNIVKRFVEDFETLNSSDMKKISIQIADLERNLEYQRGEINRMVIYFGNVSKKLNTLKRGLEDYDSQIDEILAKYNKYQIMSPMINEKANKNCIIY